MQINLTILLFFFILAISSHYEQLVVFSHPNFSLRLIFVCVS